jgi:hypothetical protein|nr:MAG TPA: hypothetical protein [Caudoviricetes sp.]
MTLLELLRQELSKRGGWPEGAERARQDADREICFEGGCGVSYNFDVDKMSDDSLHWLNENNRATSDLYVTREQYDWDGEGLPPIGFVVEFTFGTYDMETDFSGILPAEGEIVEVVAHKTTSDGNDVAVVYWDDKGAGRSACFVSGCLRPLRTEAERAIDEMVRLSGVSIGAAKILYDAGYRKG